MQTKYKVILAVVLLAIAFAGGRHSVPTKVVIQEKIVEVEKKSVQQDKNVKRDKEKTTTIREIVHPDGTKETITTITEGTKTESRTETSTEQTRNTQTETKTETTRTGNRVHLAILGGMEFNTRNTLMGGYASKEILGPITGGLWGLSNGTGGISLGLNF